jgi:hypothetical protein
VVRHLRAGPAMTSSKPEPFWKPKNYQVFEPGPRGKLLGDVPDALSLDEAAQTAATLLFSRSSARKVVASISEDVGTFIAFGRCGWMRYPNEYVCSEIRFVLRLENDKP